MAEPIILDYDDISVTATAFDLFWGAYKVNRELHNKVEVRRVKDDRVLVEYFLCGKRWVWNVNKDEREKCSVAPWASIRFQVLPGGRQKLSLDVTPWEPSDGPMLPSFQPTLSEREVEEIFDSFIAHLRSEGYLDQPSPSPTSTKDGASRLAGSVQEVSVEEIDSFKKVAEVSASEVSDLVPLQVPEANIKRMLREIIGEPFDQKDWSGETSDLFTMRVMFQGRRAPTAFLLKGPSVKGTLHIANLGKRGNQGQRLFREPASLYMIQHVDKIDSAVRDLIQMLATRKAKEIEAPVCYCLIDGVDLARLLVAYGKLKPSEDLT